MSTAQPPLQTHIAVCLSACGSVMSIPQDDPEAQGRAIASLPSYVNSCAYFLCLAGSCTHENGEPRDYKGWLARGSVHIADP